MFYAMARDLGGMDGLDFKINGEAARWEFHNEHPDIVKVHLNTSLKPGESIEINTPFHVRIPSGKISRLRTHLEGSSHKISYVRWNQPGDIQRKIPKFFLIGAISITQSDIVATCS